MNIPDEPTTLDAPGTQERQRSLGGRDITNSGASSGGDLFCRLITGLDETSAKVKALGIAKSNSRFTSLPWEAEFQFPACVQPALPNNEALGSF